MTHDDDALERLLHRADPARSIAPLDAEQITRLKETTMSRATDERTPETPAPTPRRSRRDSAGRSPPWAPPPCWPSPASRSPCS